MRLSAGVIEAVPRRRPGLGSGRLGIPRRDDVRGRVIARTGGEQWRQHRRAQRVDPIGFADCAHWRVPSVDLIKCLPCGLNSCSAHHSITAIWISTEQRKFYLRSRYDAGGGR